MNGLLTGLTECWLPDVSLAMVGQVAGLSTNSDPGLVYANNTGFPGGKSLQKPPGPSVFINSAASLLLQSIGQTDVLMVSWSQTTSDADNLPEANIGLNNANGIQYGGQSSIPFPFAIAGEIPWANGMDDTFADSRPDKPFTAGVPHMYACWYLTADSTVRISLDNGTVYSGLNTHGVGDPDPTNYFGLYFGTVNGTVEQGQTAIWQGTTGVANALSQLALLFGGLPFSQWDSGGAAIPQRAASGQYAIRTH